MAEWLGTGLQNLVHRFDSGRRLSPSLARYPFAELLAEVNASIRQLAAGSESAPAGWTFMCECGGPDCRENVPFTLDSYSALHAERLRREAQALGAEAEQQLKHARRNQNHDEHRVACSSR